MLRFSAAVSGAGNVLSLVQRGKQRRRKPDTVVRYRVEIISVFLSGRKDDPASLRIVNHAVSDQIIQHSQQKTAVSGKRKASSRPCLGKCNLILLRQTAVKRLAGSQPACFCQIDISDLDRLKRVFQFGGQIQIIDQPFHFFTFQADNPGLFPGFLRKYIVFFQLAGVSQYDGKRRADIMGHAADPFGSCIIFPAHIVGCPVQTPADFSQFPLLFQMPRFAAAQILNAL